MKNLIRIALVPAVLLSLMVHAYGRAAIELRKLFREGKLPEIEILKSTNNRARNSAGEQIRRVDTQARGPINNKAIYKDALGHPQAMLKTLSHLVWLRVIYKVDLSTFDYYPELPERRSDRRNDRHGPACPTGRWVAAVWRVG